MDALALEDMREIEAAVRAGDLSGVVDALFDGEDPSALAVALPSRGVQSYGTGNVLHLAASVGQSQVAKLLLVLGSQGGAVESRTSTGCTPLIIAAGFGWTATTQLLLMCHADVHARSKLGDTALMLAADNGQVGATKLLLQANANIEAKNNQGDTALMLAATLGEGSRKATSAQLLLDANANIEAKNIRGNTALTLAAGNGHTAAVELLLDRGADVEATTKNGSTALINAAYHGQAEAVALLLQRNADPSVANTEGKTAADYATERASSWPMKADAFGPELMEQLFMVDDPGDFSGAQGSVGPAAGEHDHEDGDLDFSGQALPTSPGADAGDEDVASF